MTAHLDRALPATIIDLIRDGTPDRELRARSDRAVYGTLCRTACSAGQRGWTFAEWAEEVTSPRSKLGTQLALKNGVKVKTAREVEGTLRAAWDSAQKWLATAGPAFTRDDVERKCKELRDLVADPSVPLGDVDRAVLAYAVGQGLGRGTDRPTLPLRATAEGAEVSVKAVRLSFARLERAGLLVCEVRGVPSGPKSRKVRASAYRLPEPSALTALILKEPESTMPTPSKPDPVFTFSTSDPELRAAIARAIVEYGEAADCKVHRSDMPSNVTPIRRGKAS